MTDAELLNLLDQKLGKGKRGNGDWYMFPCPTCTKRNAAKRKRGVNFKSLTTHCFICLIPLSIQQILGTTAKLDRVKTISSEPPPEHPQAKELPCKGVYSLADLDSSHPARRLFEKDHLFELQRYADEFHIGYIPAEGAIDLVFQKDKEYRMSTADAIVFPVYYKTQLVGWQLRYVPGTPNGGRMDKIRYLHLFHKGDYLFNYDNARQHETVILVEGAKKCLKFSNAVATLGKGITEKQFELLLNWKKIVVMYDGEQETQLKAEELVERFRSGGRKSININPDRFGFPSPDEMTKKQAQQIVETEWNNVYGGGRI